MKKFLLILLLVLGWQEVVGQEGKHPPVLLYRETDYTTDEAKRFAESGTLLANSWRDSLFLIVRNGLFQGLYSGKIKGQEEILALNEAILEIEDGNIDYLLSKVSYENRNLSGEFKNSRNENGICRFYDDSDFVGTVGIFKMEGVVEIIVYKTRCLNLLVVEPTIVESFSAPPRATPISPSSSIVLAERLVQEDPGRYDRSPYVTTSRAGQPQVSKTWIQRHWYVIPIGVATVAGVVYLIIRLCTKRDGRIEEYEIRTQPGGIVWDIPVFAF